MERPLAGGISAVTVNDPTFSDLAGVITGMKPVTYTDCLTEDLPRIAGLCGKLKLKYLLPEEFLGKRGPHFIKAKKMVLMGRNLADLKRAATAWSSQSISEEWGCLLGYPECCVKAYFNWTNFKFKLKQRPDIIRRIFANTKKTARLDFRLNNIWNYFSRMNFKDRQDCSSFDRIMDYNLDLDLPSTHVVSWHPCAYDCAESVRKAGVIFSFMQHHAPAYAAELRKRLANPVIFWDKFKYLFVDGRVKNGLLHYKAVLPPRSLLGDKLCRLAAYAGSVKADESGAQFYRGGKPLFRIPAPGPVIMNFTAQ